jgi:ferredoxin
MSQIIIDKKRCIKCNTCVAVCALKIINEASEWAYPTILEEKAEYCMKCGHCESFCPQQVLPGFFLKKKSMQLPECRLTARIWPFI